MRKDSRIFVAGHRGLVGSAICRRLSADGFHNLIVRTRSELDLRDQHGVDRFFQECQPQFVFLAAAKVGGILANSTYPAEFIYDNLALHSHRYGLEVPVRLRNHENCPKRSPLHVCHRRHCRWCRCGVYCRQDALLFRKRERPCQQTAQAIRRTTGRRRPMCRTIQTRATPQT